MPVNKKVRLVSKKELIPEIFEFEVEAKEIAETTKPGNFVEIKVSDNITPFLRRPISIYNINQEKGTITFIFQVKGEGTKILSKKQVGDEIEIMGPLGYGTFAIEPYKKVAIIGGGIGIFPLHELAKQLYPNSEVSIYLGFRNKELVVLEEEFKKVSHHLTITTDDGSYGIKGFAIAELEKQIEQEKPDILFGCGPLPMLKAVQKLAIEKEIPCQISLEEKMGCGIGACLGCAVKMVTSETPYYAHVCKMGPVFNAKEVEI